MRKKIVAAAHIPVIIVTSARLKAAAILISIADFLMSDHKIPRILIWLANKVSPDKEQSRSVEVYYDRYHRVR